MGPEKLPPAVEWKAGKVVGCRFCATPLPMPGIPPGTKRPVWITSFSCHRCHRENRFGPPAAQPVVVDSEPDPLAGETGRAILETLTEIEDKLKWN